MLTNNCADIFKKPTNGFTFNASLKKKFRDKVYLNYNKTFYCDCDYTPNSSGSSGKIDPLRCGYQVNHNSNRGESMEWEHIVPASTFGAFRDAWKYHDDKKFCGDSDKNGRECCRSLDPEFKMMEADLHNLVPEIGELNADRSNLPYGIIDGEVREYGDCDFEISKGLNIAEPAEYLRGDVARSWLYMYMTYGPEALPMADKDLKMYCEWLKSDEVTNWEIIRSSRIAFIQGNTNPYVDGSYKQCDEICSTIDLYYG